MKTEVKKIDKLKRVFTITVNGEQLDDDRKTAYAEIGKTLKVPGFRPGSAPLDILEKHHGAHLKDEFLNRMLGKYYAQALDEAKAAPAGYPRIFDVSLTAKELAFSAEVEIRPELELDEAVYTQIPVKNIVIETKQEEIEKIITNLKEGIKKVTDKDFADDDIARWAGHPDAAHLREAITAEITVEKLRDRKRKIDSQIATHLLRTVKPEVPRQEVESRHKELLEREIEHLRSRNIPDDDIEKYRKDIEEKLKPLAEDEIKLYYILEAVIKKSGLKIEHDTPNTAMGYLLSKAKYT